MFYLSYLIGAQKIQDTDLISLDISIEEKKLDGGRALIIPEENLPRYIALVKENLGNGFWNEVVGSDKILFVFKFNDSSIREYSLSLDNQKKIGKLCSEFNGESIDKTKAAYQYLSENNFYHDFILKNYADIIRNNR